MSTDAGAGEIVSSSEETRFYDDIGCLAADWLARRDGDAHAYVRIGTGPWREAHAAFFAQPRRAETAMASGFVAFETMAAASAADYAGRALTFDDMVKVEGGQP